VRLGEPTTLSNEENPVPKVGQVFNHSKTQKSESALSPSTPIEELSRGSDQSSSKDDVVVIHSKKCSVCLTLKPIDAFGTRVGTYDGKQAHCLPCARIRNNNHAFQRKYRVLSHYSNGVPKCARCGYNDLRALSLDHPNNDGAAHRKSLRLIEAKRGKRVMSGEALFSTTGNGSGGNFYKWLVRNNYPVPLIVLCMNCQFIKRSEHAKDKRNEKKDC
jgi:hypothetical protein